MATSLTLFDLTYAVAVELGLVREGIATTGNSSMITDTVARTEADNYWAGGTAWILRDAGGAGAAPEREYSAITSSVSSTGVINLKSTLTQAVVTGDRYAVGKRRFGLDKLIQKINQVLTQMGGIPVDYNLTTGTSGSQTEYALPIDAKMDIRQVMVSTYNTANDQQWEEIVNWRYKYGAAGSQSTIVFDDYPGLGAGNTVRIVYIGLHPMMQVSTDKLMESIHPTRVIYGAAAAALRERRQSLPGDAGIAADLQRLEALEQRAAQEHPIHIPTRPHRLVIAGSNTRRWPGSRSGY